MTLTAAAAAVGAGPDAKSAVLASRETRAFSEQAFPDWASTGSIVFEGDGGLTVVNPDGTGRRTVPGTFAHRAPAWSPDGRRLVAQISQMGRYQLAVMNADGSGHEIIVGEGLQPFWPDWSPDGKRIVFVGRSTLFVADADGTGVTAIAGGGDAWLGAPHWPEWSPDGRRILFSHGLAGGGPIEVLDLPTRAVTRLTSEADDHPAWSPDGTRIAFTRRLPGSDDADIYVMNADGTGVTRLASTRATEEYPTWSPGGRQIAFMREESAQGRSIWVMDADGRNQRRLRVDPAARTADGRPCTLEGTPGPDFIVGTPGNDVVCGLGGDDRIRAGGGSDVVDGGPGIDQLHGGPGDDLLLSRDRRRDLVVGGRGRDRARVDPGLDRVSSVERLI